MKGSFLFTLLIALATAFSPNAAYAINCEDNALRELTESLSVDQRSYILSLLFDRAALHMASAIHQEAKPSKTLEEKTLQIEAKLKASHPETLLKQLNTSYAQYGIMADQSTIQQMSDEKLAFCSKTGSATSHRLKNEGASAVALLMSQEPGSAVTADDAATIWAVERLRAEKEKTDSSYAMGSVRGNEMSVTAQVYAHLHSKDPNETVRNREALEQGIKTAISHLSAESKKCLGSCPTDAKRVDSFVNQIQGNLTNQILIEAKNAPRNSSFKNIEVTETGFHSPCIQSAAPVNQSKAKQDLQEKEKQIKNPVKVPGKILKCDSAAC